MTDEEEQFLQHMREANPRFPEGQLWQFIRAINTENSGIRIQDVTFDAYQNLHGFEQHYRHVMSLVAMSLGRVADADFVHLATGEKYSELYQFVTGPIHAHLLGFVAFKACWEPNFFPGFTHSTSLPEFFPQLFEWMRALHQSFPEDVNSDWRFCLKRAWEAKDQKGMHPLTIDYLLQKVALPKVERPNDVYDAVAEISRKAHQNAKKTRQRRERGIKEQENRFKDSLISNWMPAALWCRSSVEILRIIEPQAAMTSDDVTALETEMSRLGLHRPPIGRTNLLERELARAEDKFFKHYGTDL